MDSSGYVEGIDFQIFMADEKRKEHEHSEIEILYCVENEVLVTVEEAKYRMKREDLLLINAGKKHSVYCPPGTKSGILVCGIHISEKMLSEYTGQYHLLFWCNSMQDNEKSSYQELRKILNNLMIDYMNGKKEKYFWRYSQCYQLLHILLTYSLVSKGDKRPNTIKEKMDQRYEEIIHYIEMYYDTDITLNGLADKFHLSVSYLSKYIKKNLGMNFTENLYSIRLRHAVDDLLNSDKPITRVALDHGFPSVAVFNRQFKTKYEMTPSDYRGIMKKPEPEIFEEQKPWEIDLIHEHLKKYFGIQKITEKEDDTAEVLKIKADISVSEPYEPIWNQAINVGKADSLLYTEIQEALLFANEAFHYKYARIWGIFSGEFYIVKNGQWNPNGFRKLNEVIRFLLNHQMKPMIELGEKPSRIMISPAEFLKEPENYTEFTDYSQFLECLEAMMKNFVSNFGCAEVESWPIEIWEDKRTEVYHDKVPYIQLFRDCCAILKKHAPGIQVGGAGNHLGWYHEHTEESIRKWIDSGTYPDYLTFTYYPYAAGDKYQEKFSKRKSDESDVMHSLESLNQILLHYGFPRRSAYITDWNMSMSSRNVFHDSLWKGCYILKSNLESLGKVKALIYGQLTDLTSDYYDAKELINGSGGFLTNDRIEKPAYIAMRYLGQLKNRIVQIGDGYFITVNKKNEVSIIVYNFIARNYLYFIKEENENSIEEHYRYLEHQKTKKMEIILNNMPADMKYDVRHYITNRDYGSIMDEWMELSCLKYPTDDDIEYLRRITTPKIKYECIRTDHGSLKLECHLKPLEMRLIKLTVSRNQ